MRAGTDHAFMSQALALAEKGLYTASPNPRVGCVLVANGQVVGQGLHRRAGEPHAEIHALAAAGKAALGATAYVTLEPCSHTGRTGPCAAALAAAGIRRVVIAMQDPNPLVSGRGMAMLENAGLEVSSGILEAEAKALNPGFISRMSRGRPYVTLKMAMSLDGRTAMRSGQSQWITGPQARRQVQHLRAKSCAILSGVESVIMDDSRLTVRSDQLTPETPAARIERQPLRVVLDSRLRLPLAAACLSAPGQTLIITTTAHCVRRRGELERAGAEIVVLDADHSGRIELAGLLDWLARERQINELLVETGATLAGAMMQASLLDELQFFVAPTLLGSDARPVLDLPGIQDMADQQRLRIDDIRAVGSDWKITARPHD